MSEIMLFFASPDGSICILIFSAIVIIFLLTLAFDTLVIGPHGSPNPYDEARAKGRSEIHVVDHFDNGTVDAQGIYHRKAVDITDGVRKGKR
jgi:hypothetical protein